MSRRKINFQTDFNLVCSNDELRPVMGHIYFHDGYMVGTNGHVLLRQKLELHESGLEEYKDLLEGKMIHSEAFKAIRKHHVIKVENGSILGALNGTWVTYPLRSIKDVEPTRDKWLDYNAVIPTSEHVETVDKIGITPTLLHTLYRAMIDRGCGYNMIFHGSQKAIKITARGIKEEEQVAILMPVIGT